MRMRLLKIEGEYWVVGIKASVPKYYYYDGFIKKIRSTNGAEYAYADHVFPIVACTHELAQDNVLKINRDEVERLLEEKEEGSLIQTLSADERYTPDILNGVLLGYRLAKLKYSEKWFSYNDGSYIFEKGKERGSDVARAVRMGSSIFIDAESFFQVASSLLFKEWAVDVESEFPVLDMGIHGSSISDTEHPTSNNGYITITKIL